MKIFVCRVELRGNPGVLTYARLHTAMKGIGFKRSLPATDGQRYDLPHAMYVAYTRSTCEKRNARVIAVVKPIWKDHLVLTMEVEEIAGFLLLSNKG